MTAAARSGAPGSPRFISGLCRILIVRLLISSRLEFAYVLASPQYRALAAENAAITRAEAARVAAIPGPVACQNLVVCRMAGKPFVYDHFWITQLVETGRMTWHQVEQLARRKAIVRDDTDRVPMYARSAPHAFTKQGSSETIMARAASAATAAPQNGGADVTFIRRGARQPAVKPRSEKPCSSRKRPMIKTTARFICDLLGRLRDTES